MLSKNKIKYIHSLKLKKNRENEKVFLIEGDKIVIEAIENNQDMKLLCATENFLTSLRGTTQSRPLGVLKESSSTNCCLTGCSAQNIDEIICVTEQELQKASLMQSPQNALAIVGMPERPFHISSIHDKFSLALDFIQDPGNLGTIIRLADWFGIDHLLCSENTVDCYNPKTIQASMGSIFRVSIHYLNLPLSLDEALREGLSVYGAFLEGENIYQHQLSETGILVMGNEGNGISSEIEEKISQKLFIPSFPSGFKCSESLNVATATAICCSEFRRRLQK